MKKFELYVVTSGELNKKPIVCNGFAEAEKKAHEVYAKVYPDYPCDDTYIACVNSRFELDYDHLILQKDCFGDIYWRKMVYGDYGPLYATLLSEEEQQELQEWREQVELHVEDLSENELKELYGQVVWGSMYLSDYSNDWDIEEEEVCDVCEDYERWVSEEKFDDTEETFAHYIMDVR